MNARELANLVVTRSETASGYLTFRGLVTSRPAKGYASLYFGGGINYGDRLHSATNTLRWSFRAVCVGYDDDQALYVLGKVRGLFTNWRPTDDPADGWFTEAPDDPPLIKNDDDPNDVRFSITPRFTITTRST